MSTWLHDLLVVGGPAIVVALALGRWLVPKWIDQLLQIRLERFKSEQQKEIERLRHRLSSRISKIHEKEFEVLPKAWLMLNDLRGSVALALDMTMKSYPDFRTLPDLQFEEFLSVTPATRLSDYQRQELRNLERPVDWSPFLRQTVKTHFSLNGELSHGIVTQAVHAGV
jgi:hypothetical protein